MYKFLVAGLLSTAAIGYAYGQEQAQPCQRSPTHVVMGGVDADESRCRELLLTQEIGQLQLNLSTVQSRLLLQSADLKTSQAELDYWHKWADGVEAAAKEPH